MATAELTVREVAELADVSVRSVNKAIEEEIVAPHKVDGKKRRITLPSHSVPYAAVVGRLDLPLTKATKRKLWSAFKKRKVKEMTTAPVEIAHAVTINVADLVGADLGERTDAYLRRREEFIETNPEILGGTPIIRGTRLSVYSLLGRIDYGDTVESIVEEYPHLSVAAVDTALTYARSHPLIGRPGGRPWARTG